MIGIRQLQEILKQYERHGWTLRRVLLSAPLRKNLPVSMFDKTEVRAADFDAFWFSRPSAKGEAWELRSISSAPFALVEIFEEDEVEEIREEIRMEMETRMQERASKPIARKLKDSA
jgi:hypothetical protein